MDIAAWSKPILAAACASLVLAACHSIVSAQPTTAAAPAPERLKNVQVLPADMPRAQVFAVMKRFSQALGVRCTHCHVGEEGKPLSTFDFASDAKREKLVARAMMRMTQRLNQESLAGIAGLKDAKVSCYTCHRGATKPATEAPAAPAS